METLQVALGRRSYPIYIGGRPAGAGGGAAAPAGCGPLGHRLRRHGGALYGAPLPAAPPGRGDLPGRGGLQVAGGVRPGCAAGWCSWA